MYRQQKAAFSRLIVKIIYTSIMVIARPFMQHKGKPPNEY